MYIETLRKKNIMTGSLEGPNAIKQSLLFVYEYSLEAKRDKKKKNLHSC